MSQRDLFGSTAAEPEAETHRSRYHDRMLPQQVAVLDALHDAYPHAISHAELCALVDTNRCSHRIAELQADGWQIDGCGVLPLDEVSKTQLYRLRSLEREERDQKLVGLTVRWTLEDGLAVRVHKDCDGAISRADLAELADEIRAMVQAKFPHLDPAARKLLREQLR